jgi:hypothetical protein
MLWMAEPSQETVMMGEDAEVGAEELRMTKW